jgi:2-amino-4-hydroxy-6-hydroxymethyldihydropteridine diphosphokinase
LKRRGPNLRSRPAQAYAIGLGSNRPHGRFGPPERVIAAALATLEADGVRVTARSRTIATPPLGPSIRRFANAAALVETRLDPPTLLALLKRLEHRFGRRRGRRWGARVLDLDILLWSHGTWRTRDLLIPHLSLGERRFVLGPLREIAQDWPTGHGTVMQAYARLTRPRPIHRNRNRSGP